MGEVIYFGRPVSTYGNVDLERRLKAAITLNFMEGDKVDILDPQGEEHQRGYREYRERTGSGMNYFLIEMLPRATKGVFLPFEDGQIGAGVWTEADYLLQSGKEIFEISYRGDISVLTMDESRRLSVEDTRARLKR